MHSEYKKTKYIIVIVDYKSLEQTCRYIELFEQACEDFTCAQFIVIDNWNGSNRKEQRVKNGFIDTHDSFEDHHNDSVEIWHRIIGGQDVWLLTKNENLGYAKANNLGIVFSDKFLHAPYAVFSNNDIQFPVRFQLSSFEDVFQKYDDCFALGPEIIGLDGNRQGPVLQKKECAFRELIRPYSIFRLWMTSGIVYSQKDFKFGKVHHTSGAFFIAKIDLLKKMGMFDENTFLYYEEDILSERGKLCGLNWYYDASIRIVHEGGATTSRSLPMFSQQKASFKSAIYYYANYCNTNWIFLAFARFNFYCVLAPLFPFIKRIYKKISYQK